MKKIIIFTLLLATIQLTSNAQTEKKYVVYLINAANSATNSSLAEKFSICDSAFSEIKFVKKKPLVNTPYNTYKCTGNVNDYVLQAHVQKKVILNKNSLNLKISQANPELTTLRCDYYCFDYLNKKQKKEKIPRYYKGLNKGVVNVGNQMAYNDIKLNSDTTYIFAFHFYVPPPVLKYGGSSLRERINIYMEIIPPEQGKRLVKKKNE